MGVTKETAPVVLRRQNIIIKVNRFLPERKYRKSSGVLCGSSRMTASPLSAAVSML